MECEHLCEYCGVLDWTVMRYGRITHKEACPHRSDEWSQSKPTAGLADIHIPRLRGQGGPAIQALGERFKVSEQIFALHQPVATDPDSSEFDRGYERGFESAIWLAYICARYGVEAAEEQRARMAS